jgi:hypothetical protein
MSYGLRKSGITKDTPKNIPLGAGTFYKNLKFVEGSWTGDIISATAGGSELNITSNLIDIEIDGATVKVKGMTQKVGESGSLKVKMVELTKDILKMSIIGKEVVSDVPGYDRIETKALIDDGDYFDNVAFVGYKADGTPIIIIMENALFTSGLSYKSENGKNNVVEGTFECTADNDGDVMDVLPIKIYLPNAAPRLASLSLGSLTVSPVFVATTANYSVATTNATNTITATAEDIGATVEIKNGDTVVASGAAATWVDGENTVNITVAKSGVSRIYTIVVTKS